MKLRLLAVLAASSVLAAADPPPTLTVFHGTWLQTNFVDVVPRLVSGSLETRPAHFVGVAVADDIVPQIRLGLSWIDPWMGPLEWEVQGLRHYGWQDHIETSAAVIARTADLNLGDALAVNIAVGEGLSYAYGGADHEIGRDGERGEDPVELQNHLIYEAEFAYPGWRRIRFATRLHHRSGAWGLISPQRTGSNFIALGVRVEL